MADNNLNEEVRVVVSDAGVVTVPIDNTLTHSNEAADAKAVGDALALKADKSELQNAVTVNGQSADAQGHIIVTAADVKMGEQDNTTIVQAIDAVNGKTAADIPVSSATGAPTIAEALESAANVNAETIPMSGSDATSIAAKIGAMVNVENANSAAIVALNGRTGADMPVSAEDPTTVADALAGSVKTVNGEGPDDDGNVQITHAMTADNLTSSASQTVTGEFARRASGGHASIHTGSAWMSLIRGGRQHVGYVPESLNMSVTTAPREEGQAPITATIDRDTFVQAVSGSTVVTLTYTVSWNDDPATYGVTVSGTPASGDQITITYVQENRGTIYQSDPQTFVSTGWNLYDNAAGYAVGLRYSDNPQFRIGGTYSAVKFSSTINGEKTTITPQDGLFTIPANGYIWVEGGNATDTYVFMTWTDWVLPEDAPAEFEAYNADVIDLSGLMADHFPNGLMRVADIRDEIDFNTGIATSRVQRMSYSPENVETAKASGLSWEADTNYIYIERAAAVEYDLDDYELTGMYNADDHGLEMFTGTDVAVYTVMVYGNNLKNKLERDVLTISSQELTAAQKAQVLSTIGGASQAAVDSLNSKLTYKAGDVLTFASGGTDAFFGFALQSNQIYCYIPLAKPVSANSISVTYPSQLAMRTVEGLKQPTATGISVKTIGKSTIQLAVNVSNFSMNNYNTPIVVSGSGFEITFGN